MKSILGRSFLSFIIVVFCLCVFFSLTFAQDLDDVIINGKVTDANGAIVVGATITAIQIDQKVERSAITDTNGRFIIIELSPGKYSVRVYTKGFGVETRTDLDTISGQTIRLDFSLVPANVRAEQTVSIDDIDAPAIDTTRTVVGGTVTAREIEELPNTSNDVLDLVYSLGGTSEEPFSIRNLAGDDRIGEGSARDQPSEVFGAGNISLAGGAAYSTNITIDGLDNNDDTSAEERFQPPIDSVAEIQVITNQFSAEYGRASGGRINIRTKAGAKKFRGRFFTFFKDDSLNANTYNNNRRHLERLPFTEYNPGGTLSGPVPFWYFKDKTYFFSSYSYQKRAATLRIFTALPVEQNPRYPLPPPTDPERQRRDFDDETSPFIAPYIVDVPTPNKRHRFTQRIDHNFTDSHNITFNYQYGRSVGFRQYFETSRFLEETLQGTRRNNDSFYFTDNYVINSKLVNQIRLQFSNYRPDISGVNPLDPVVILNLRDETLDEDDVNQIRGTVVVGNSTIGIANVRSEKRYQIQETLNYIQGDYNFRFGFDIQNINSVTNELNDATGTFNFDTVENFLVSQPVRFRRNFGQTAAIENTYTGFFVQGDWRIRSNLTFSGGLRYERETILDDNNNFGPRVALAYSPGESGKSVIRLGGGVFYNRTLLRTITNFTTGAIPLGNFDSRRLEGPSDEDCSGLMPADDDYASDKCIFLRYLASDFPTAPTEAEIRAISGIGDIGAGFVNINTTTELNRRIEPAIKIPESYQFNVGYEREIGRDFAFEVNFTFNKSVRLWREQNINAHRVPDGFNNFTEYLISLGDITIPGTRSGTDTYRFELGDPTDPIGDRNPTSPTGMSECNSNTPLCIVNLNTLNGSRSDFNAIGIALRVLNATLNRPVTDSFDQLEEVGSRGKSVYEGLSFELRRRFRSLGYGFKSAMRFSYVLSRTRDDGFVDTSNSQVQGDFQSDFARSSNHRRHKFRFTGSIETPTWLGNIRLSPLIRVESGRPFNISGGGDRNLDDVSNDRPNYSGDLSNLNYRGPNDPFPEQVFDLFTLNPIGTPTGGNLPRNAGRGPALFIFDLSLSRQFIINERVKIKPQISFDNILNAKIFSFGSDFINFARASTGEFGTGFLVPGRTLRQRQIQFGIRADF